MEGTKPVTHGRRRKRLLLVDIEKTLSELQLLLAGRNYVVFLHRYCLPIVAGANAADYITQQLPDAVIGKIQPCSGQEMADKIAHCLKYAGDRWTGPLPENLSSSTFEGLLAAFLNHLSQQAAEATNIFHFWLEGGHPDYPVFWDFAFVIVGSKNAEIIIGSSPD